MSTFCGKFTEEEFKDIAIDNFLHHNHDANTFFLSHCHSDHMKGLSDPYFHDRFSHEGVYLYCSDISKRLLLKNGSVKIPENRIIVLKEFGNSIVLGNGLNIKVTSLPAGHCPGSIMLLFEGFNRRILYTGDFRLTMKDLKKLKPLHSPGGEVVPLDSLYFDSTFANPTWETFPSHQESLDNIKKVITPWLERNQNNKVIIDQPAYIGMEYLMIELSNLSNSPKIHVSEQIVDSYLSAIDAVNIFTTSLEESRIHFCYRRNSWKCGANCFKQNFQGAEILTIFPSALSFTTELQKSRGVCFYDSSNRVRITYSSHPSFRETLDIINYLKPSKLYPCVVPTEKSLEEFTDDIMFHIKQYTDVKRKCTVDEDYDNVLKEFLIDRSPKKNRIDKHCLPGMESPPR